MPSKNISSDKKRTRWGEKPYYSLDYYLKNLYGHKVYKIALEGGMTCPNRDGTLDSRGCIFCSNGGSGEFAISEAAARSVFEQIEQAISFLTKNGKKTGDSYIAYFQSFSNTYAPVSRLRSLYMEAIAHPKVVGLAIGTRPDCFSDDIYDLITECNQIKPTWIELGLQTMHEKTAQWMRRGYPLSVFEECVRKLRSRDISVVTHIILGLPYETTQDILQTIAYLNSMDIQGIKLQLLHVLKDTDLAKLLPKIHIYSLEEYIDVLLQCIAHLSPDIVIHRLTGDGPKDLLLAPMWSTHKRYVLNQIAHAMKTQNIYQGKEC